MEIEINDDVLIEYQRAYFLKNGCQIQLTEEEVKDICERYLMSYCNDLSFEECIKNTSDFQDDDNNVKIYEGD